MEPEIICFVEGTENAIEDDVTQNSEEGYFEAKGLHLSVDSLSSGKREYPLRNNCYSVKNEQLERRVVTKAQQKEDYSLEAKSFKDEQNNLFDDSLNRVCTKLPQNEDLLITKENFLMKYEVKPSECNENLQVKFFLY